MKKIIITGIISLFLSTSAFAADNAMPENNAMPAEQGTEHKEHHKKHHLVCVHKDGHRTAANTKEEREHCHKQHGKIEKEENK